MIKEKINSSDLNEELDYIKTTYTLPTNEENKTQNHCIQSIKNIRLLPRCGTHNNSNSYNETIIYIVSGTLSYLDTLGNSKELTRGNIIYINSGSGLTYEIFNNGHDVIDFIEIKLSLSLIIEEDSNTILQYSIPKVLYSIEENIPENQWKYRLSSKSGLASIKSFCDLNIYSLTLTSDEVIDFKVNKDRIGYLIQGYGESIFVGHKTNSNIVLIDEDGLKIKAEDFKLKSKVNSNFLFIETYL